MDTKIKNSHNNIPRWPPKLTTQDGCQKPILSRFNFDLKRCGTGQNLAHLFMNSIMLIFVKITTFTIIFQDDCQNLQLEIAVKTIMMFSVSCLDML